MELYRVNDVINWEEVADYVGEGISADQCNKRWVRNIRPENQLYQQGPWDEKEVIIAHNTPQYLSFPG